MRVEFKTQYDITQVTPREFESSFEISEELIIKEVTETARYHLTFTEADIEETIMDLLNEEVWDNNYVYLPEDEKNDGFSLDIDSDSAQVFVLNGEKIVSEMMPLLLHLVKKEYIKPCCKAAPGDANYCPTCGKKLK